MRKQPVSLGIFIGLSMGALLCASAAGQTQTGSTETEVWPEIDAHVQLRSHLCLLALGGVEQGIGFAFQQWYSATAIGYQFKPILGPHLLNIDPDKEHHFLFGGGYEFLRTIQSGDVHHENRVTIDGIPNLRLGPRFLLRDRSWIELRWIDGKYSTTYRNMLSVERDFLLHGFRFTPYGAAEVFYDGPSIPGISRVVYGRRPVAHQAPSDVRDILPARTLQAPPTGTLPE